MSTNKILAWHFVGETLRDGRPVPKDGVVLRHDGNVVICKSGLHASVRIMDALRYAPGETLCRVECGGTIVHGDDKFVASERTILWRIDATEVLLKFARHCALDVAHLWDMPAVVREYLEAGDETKQAAAAAAAAAGAAAAAAAGTWAAEAAGAAAAAAAGTWAAEAAGAAAGTWAAEAAGARAAAWAMEARAMEARAEKAAAWGSVDATRRAFKERQEARLVGMVEEYRLSGRA